MQLYFGHTWMAKDPDIGLKQSATVICFGFELYGHKIKKK